MEAHKRPAKKQPSVKKDCRETDSLKTGVVKTGFKEFNLDDVLDDEIDQDVLSKKLIDWTPLDVKRWIFNEGFSSFWPFLQHHNPTGIDLLMLNEYDWVNLFRETHIDNPVPSVIATKRLLFRLNQVKLAQGLHKTAPKLSYCLTGNFSPHFDIERVPQIKDESVDDFDPDPLKGSDHYRRSPVFASLPKLSNGNVKRDHSDSDSEDEEIENRFNQRECTFCHHQFTREKSEIPRERWKTLLAFGYCLVVSWVTAFVMVIVHDRVPDMEKYPPLPDILLDNIPHIPWAFEMCEMAGMILMCLWGIVLLFHKHRFVLMRRFFSISGTIFLLRCVTMLITSLSVPGRHLDCQPRPYGDIWNKLHNAYIIWTGAGMTIKGVRTCGDYMFSGHTVALTLLNFFITEYTSRKIYFLHTVTWVCNVFGVFFILAAHEHYSIDVFVAFYITSRLFMYYHTLANQPASINFQKTSKPTIGHFSYDSHRVWLWFPLFSFFESSIDGKVPNEFEWPITVQDIKNYCLKLVEQFRGLFEKISIIINQEKVKSLEHESKRQDKKDPSKAKKRKQHFKRE